MEFSRPGYWGGWPFPSSGDLPNPEIEPRFPGIAGGFFTSWATREAHKFEYFKAIPLEILL